MKPFLRTILIWILSLSLTGMPIAALSQDRDDLESSGKDTASEASAEHGNDVPCYHSSAQAGAKVVQTTSQAIEAQKSDASMDDSCCCGTDCRCHHDMACQTVGHFSLPAILSSILFISSPLNSQLIPESAVLYCYRDAELDIIPPIA